MLMQRRSPIFLSVWGIVQLSSPLFCPSGCSRSRSSQIATQRWEGFSLSQAKTLGEKNSSLLLSIAPSRVNSELSCIKQNKAKKQKRSAGTAGSAETLAASFPTSFSLTIFSTRFSQTPHLQRGAEEQQISEWAQHTKPPQLPGFADAPAQPCALSYLKSPGTPLQPPALTCPQIPQGLSSVPTLHLRLP